MAAIAVLAVVVGAVGVGGTGRAGASCVGPRLGVDRTVVAVGTPVEIRGQYFGTACNDTVEGDAGPPDNVLGGPETHIELRVAQNGVTTSLARVGANADYKFAVRVILPAAVEAGPAAIDAITKAFGATQPIAIDILPGGSPVAATTSATILVGEPYGAPRGGTASDSPAAPRHSYWPLWGELAAIIVLVVIAIMRRRSALRRG